MGPDPTWAYFWPAVNKGPTCLQPRYFLTRSEGKKIEKFDILRGNFPNSNPNHKWLTNPSHKKIVPTRSKIFEPDPSLPGHSQNFTKIAQGFAKRTRSFISIIAPPPLLRVQFHANRFQAIIRFKKILCHFAVPDDAGHERHYSDGPLHRQSRC